MNYQHTNSKVSSSDIFNDIEKRIKSNYFKNKEELSKYILNLKERGFLTQEEIKLIMPDLLGKYDNLNQTSDLSLSINMDGYKGIGLEEQNLIVAKEEARILKTEENHENIKQEFTRLQNEIIASNGSASVYADEVFSKMAERKKEELSLVSLFEVLSDSNIDKEMLQKIKYFITNRYINPYSFKIDVGSGIFYNIETSEVLEVKKDMSTNQYHIYKGGEIVYSDSVSETYEEHQKEEKPDDYTQDEEYQYGNINEQHKSKPKTRVLRPPHMNNYNNAAFSKMNFLLLIIGMFTASIVFINILSKFIKWT